MTQPDQRAQSTPPATESLALDHADREHLRAWLRNAMPFDSDGQESAERRIMLYLSEQDAHDRALALDQGWPRIYWEVTP